MAWDLEQNNKDFKKMLLEKWNTYKGNKHYLILERHACFGYNIRDFNTFKEAKKDIVNDLYCNFIAIVSKNEVWLKGDING